MSKTLILFAHPRLEKSRSNKALLARIKPSPNLTFNDLYEEYPDFNIDVEREKKLLLEHDVIIWQHPFFWYSCPPLLKQWIDLVLELGWAYGPGGTALKGKIIFNAVTTGGSVEAYKPTGHNRFTVRQYLYPFDQTANLCKMIYLAPFAVQGTHKLTSEKLTQLADQYERLLHLLTHDQLDIEAAIKAEFLNDILEQINQ
ncbi:MAG TPA: NAD(P)H-dependent oxidoreductase [Chitinophagaceae bacterium]|nr:NAD(P)H-dependent oxidoreductase [Chitinophagaceae bacterium]